MSLIDAIKQCFQKYIDFQGRAGRAEFWWFFLFYIIVEFVLESTLGAAAWVFLVGALLPLFAVGARRLHDTNRSAWMLLIALIPFIGWVILIYFFASKGDEADNQYGPVPTVE